MRTSPSSQNQANLLDGSMQRARPQPRLAKVGIAASCTCCLQDAAMKVTVRWAGARSASRSGFTMVGNLHLFRLERGIRNRHPDCTRALT